MSRIGIIEPNFFNVNANLKTHLVFFDKLLIDINALEENYKAWELALGGNTAKMLEMKQRAFTDVEYLIKKGFLKELDTEISNHKNAKIDNMDGFNHLTNLMKEEMDSLKLKDKNEFPNQVANLIQNFATRTRFARFYLSEADHTNDYSALLITSNKNTSIVKGDERVTSLILDKLPIPTDTVPLEKIIEFINDDDIKRDRLRLQSWLGKHNNSTQSLTQLNEEIESLIQDYENKMKLILKEYKYTVSEIIVKLPLEFAENVVKLKWSMLIDPFFKYKKASINLLKEETKARGNEFAFICKVKENLK